MNKTLTLRFSEHSFINTLKNGSFNENDFFNRMSKKCNLDHIIKIANANSTFEKMCKKEEYNSLWGEQYSQIGYVLTSGNEVSINLLPNKEGNFDLLRGAYFFYKSQVVRKELLGVQFSSEELLFLDKAIKYGSVHAIQEHNNYVYMEINNEKSKLDYEEKISLIDETITNCERMLETYGSYAYMMLAEAYFHYAQLVIKQDKNNLDDTKSAIEAAIKSCDTADKYLKKYPNETKNAIHNASLGQKLENSNSFKIPTPNEAKEFLSNWIKEQELQNQPPLFEKLSQMFK